MTYVSIPDFDNYQVSNLGTVRKKLKNGGYRVINPWLSDSHYSVTLVNETGRKVFYIHRLVLIAFGPPMPADRPLCMHLDDNPANNCIQNLMWGDKRMNAMMAVSNGRLCPAELRVFLTREEAEAVREEYAAGKSMQQIATLFGCSRWTISNIVHNRTARLS